MAEIDGFIGNAVTYLDSYFKKNIESQEIDLFQVYPYIRKYSMMEMPGCIEEDVFDYLGVLYESQVPNDVKKDLGQFYTREDAVIEMMVNSIDVLSGKILEPSCGSGLFLVKTSKVSQV